MKDNFFVHVIESPEPAEILDDVSEGRALRKALWLCGIPSSFHLAVDEQSFNCALIDKLVEAVEEYRLLPVIHLSLHGDEGGIWLTNDHKVRWSPLAERLRLINKATGGKLLVTLSACFGIFGERMAIGAEELPFKWLVGHPAKAKWSTLFVAYVAFFHHLQIGTEISKAVTAMQIASGDLGFEYREGAKTRERYKRSIDEVIAAMMGLPPEHTPPSDIELF